LCIKQPCAKEPCAQEPCTQNNFVHQQPCA
jgi:hypothetical protein